MAHLVRYRTADGHEADHEVAELADAIAHVERLRNEEGVEGARIYKIEEVTFEFKPYFRVEIGGTTATPAASRATDTPSVAESMMAPVWAPPVETTTEPETDHTPAHLADDAEPAVTLDPWADAPPPPAPADETTAVGGGPSRRGLFGR